jgi:hypothetical protein
MYLDADSTFISYEKGLSFNAHTHTQRGTKFVTTYIAHKYESMTK